MKICVVTATRAEYGLLRPLIRIIEQDNECDLQLLVTGAHLSRGHGFTIQEIEQDGFPIAQKIPILSDIDSPLEVAKTVGMATGLLAQALVELQPDIIVIPGDRYEMLAMASAALLLQIPVAHLCGGETTLGAIDESIRHAITKLSHLHFTTTEVYRRRVIQLGENPSQVFNVGALGIENIRNLEMLEQAELEKSLDVQIQRPFFLVTFHPETLQSSSQALTPTEQIKCLLNALQEFSNAMILFTMPNADAGASAIRQYIKQFVAKRSNAYAMESLGMLRYLSILQYVDVVIGNSSSGIVEVPSFSIPTINIGDRQKGRIAADSVIHCQCEFQEIVQAIKKATNPQMQTVWRDIKNPYELEGSSLTSELILNQIKMSHPVSVQKLFYDQ